MPSKSKMSKNEEIHDSDADVSDIDFNSSESESEEMDLSEHSSDEEFLDVSNFFYFIYFFRKPSLKAKKKKTTLKYDALVHHEMGFTIFISHFIFHHYS
jgi:hypothetical protein